MVKGETLGFEPQIYLVTASLDWSQLMTKACLRVSAVSALAQPCGGTPQPPLTRKGGEERTGLPTAQPSLIQTPTRIPSSPAPNWCPSAVPETYSLLPRDLPGQPTSLLCLPLPQGLGGDRGSRN